MTQLLDQKTLMSHFCSFLGQVISKSTKLYQQVWPWHFVWLIRSLSSLKFYDRHVNNALKLEWWIKAISLYSPESFCSFLGPNNSYQQKNYNFWTNDSYSSLQILSFEYFPKNCNSTALEIFFSPYESILLIILRNNHILLQFSFYFTLNR